MKRSRNPTSPPPAASSDFSAGTINRRLLTPCRRLGLSRKRSTQIKLLPDVSTGNVNLTLTSYESTKPVNKSAKTPSETNDISQSPQKNKITNGKSNKRTRNRTRHYPIASSPEGDCVNPIDLNDISKSAIKNIPDVVTLTSTHKMKSTDGVTNLLTKTAIEDVSCDDIVDTQKNKTESNETCTTTKNSILLSDDSDNDNIPLKDLTNSNQPFVDLNDSKVTLHNIRDNKDGIKQKASMSTMSDDDFDDRRSSCSKLLLNESSTSKKNSSPNLNDQTLKSKKSQSKKDTKMKKSKSETNCSKSNKTKISKIALSQNSVSSSVASDSDDDFEVKTTFKKKSLNTVSTSKNQKSVIQEIEEIKTRLKEKKEKLEMLKIQNPKVRSCFEFQNLIITWRTACQSALLELIEVNRNKNTGEKVMMDELLNLLHIPSDLVKYDIERMSFT
ncbi:uncharacterized protein LOC143913441 [Arctopsyche grandis]|uniref:uncharacterized protein LOC143913441 n=1 Tax=Arctopsyche grandis TaxID=121162 RepID=UPI00406D9289